MIGPQWDKATQDYYSCEKQVDDNTPPAFLVHAKDDTVVPCRNSQLYKKALDAHGRSRGNWSILTKVAIRLRLSLDHEDTNRWLAMTYQWMQDMNIVK